ncbi:interleukin-17C-like [Branchiostoma floridae]|uniref:Interleukin-17C-like n=1 Tax=Branchiostoma floridae TaxID=7739 RepID=A0A9J7HNM0_BRAFL|nr:interleukin-17C-like [Branchiostoma floridae]
MKELKTFKICLLVVGLLYTTDSQAKCTLKEPRERLKMKRLNLNLRTFNKTAPFKMGLELAANETVSQPELYPHNANMRASAPWRWELDHDENRYPPNIGVAVCESKHCYDHQNNRQDDSNNSVPVNRTVPVLIKEKMRKNQKCPKNGRHKYRKEWISIAVACICVRPKLPED